MSFKRFTFAFALATLAVLLPDLAAAQGNPTGLDATIGVAVCELANAVTGRAGRGLATLAIIFLGIGAFFGKVNWGLAVMIAVGIGAIFGASTIAGIVAAGGGTC